MEDFNQHIGRRMQLRDGSVTDTPLRRVECGGTHCLTAKCGDKKWLWHPAGWWGNIGMLKPLDLMRPIENSD